MADAAEENSNQQRPVGFLQLPLDAVMGILDHVDSKTARNVFQLTKSTVSLAKAHNLDWKTIPMTKLVCTVLESDVILRKYTLTGETWTGKTLQIPKADVIPFVHKCAPQQLCLNGSDQFLGLRADWWKDISKVTLNLTGTVLGSYLPFLKHCTQLDVWYSESCNATDIVNSMASLERFKFVGAGVKITEATLLALGAAIQKGKGLTHLEICTHEANQWVSLQAYINFVKTIKYCCVSEQIGQSEVLIGNFSVFATKRQIHQALLGIYEKVSIRPFGFRFERDSLTNDRIVELLIVAIPEPPKDLVD